MSKRCSFCSFLVGGLIGAAVGLLFAKKKGVELREEIFEKAMDVITDSQGIKEDLSDFIRTVKNQKGEILDQDSEIVLSRSFEDE